MSHNHPITNHKSPMNPFIIIPIILVYILCTCYCEDNEGKIEPLYNKNNNLLRDVYRIKRRGKYEIEATTEFINKYKTSKTVCELNTGTYLICRNDRMIELAPISQ